MMYNLHGARQYGPFPGYFKWTSANVFSQNLYCEDFCKTGIPSNSGQPSFQPNPREVCCYYTARPYWAFPSNRKFVHFLSIVGTNIINLNKTRNLSVQDQPLVYYWKHSFKQLSYFPSNLCAFRHIVNIELDGNNITRLPNVSCFQELDTLNLSYNYIKMIRSTSFSRLINLRVLDLSFNMISTIEAGTFGYRPGTLMFINLTGNRLTEIDMSNVILGYQFVEMNLSSNSLSKITNKFNLTYSNEGDVRGGGVIDVRNNKFRSIPDLKQIGLKSFQMAIKFIWRYYPLVRGNPLICDCDVFDFMKMAIEASKYLQVVDLSCTYPNGLKSIFKDFRKNESLLDFFICKINMNSKCPFMCNCFNQPSQKRIVVNCSISNYTKMPHVLPNFDNLDIDFSHNYIRTLLYHEYLNRTKILDLSYNQITYIETSIYSIQSLDYIDLRHNHIKTLDRAIQQRSPQYILLGTLFLGKCDCTFRWIQTWVDRPIIKISFHSSNIITCSKGDSVINISLWFQTDDCRTKKSYIQGTLFAFGVCLLLASCCIYHNFRYEFHLLMRKYKRHCNYYVINKKAALYDVYLSFCLNNDDVTKWTINCLCRYLENKGIVVCLPPRDFIAGGVEMEQIGTNVEKSNAFIVLLSKDYEHNQFQITEWQYIYNDFMAEPATELVVINFDMLSSSEIINQKLKAFIRLGWYYDFQNFDKTLLSKIKNRISTK